MKIYIKSSTDLKYLYILKHGLGPGTLPEDVTIVKSKDLPNYYTAVWLDRFLTSDELKEYDIPSETEINYYLGRIGYCQDNGDIIPCDDVEACDEVTASSNPLKSFKILDLTTGEASDIDIAAESSRRALERFLECDVTPVTTREEADYAVCPYGRHEIDRYYAVAD